MQTMKAQKRQSPNFQKVETSCNVIAPATGIAYLAICLKIALNAHEPSME